MFCELLAGLIIWYFTVHCIRICFMVFLINSIIADWILISNLILILDTCETELELQFN